MKTETCTDEMEARIMRAVPLALGVAADSVNAVFEHGQWWVKESCGCCIWSVVDAEGPGTVDGFDFELVG